MCLKYVKGLKTFLNLPPRMVKKLLKADKSITQQGTNGNQISVGRISWICFGSDRQNSTPRFVIVSYVSSSTEFKDINCFVLSSWTISRSQLTINGWKFIDFAWMVRIHPFSPSAAIRQYFSLIFKGNYCVYWEQHFQKFRIFHFLFISSSSNVFWKSANGLPKLNDGMASRSKILFVCEFIDQTAKQG